MEKCSFEHLLPFSNGLLRSAIPEIAAISGISQSHADRVRPFEDYCVGLLSAEGRKSVEPLAAVTALDRTAAHDQSLDIRQRINAWHRK